MLSRLFAGGHAVTAVGDPNQAIYGWRGASVSNILRLRRHVPGRRRRAPDLPADRQPALRPPHPRGGQPAGRAALREYAGQVVRLAAKPDAGRGPTSRCGCCRRRPTSSPGWPTRWTPPTRRGAEVVRRRGAHPGQRPRRRRLRRADRPRHPGRDRRPLRADPTARGRRGGRHAAPAQRRHRQRLPAHPAHRTPLGDRPARPAAARPPRRRAGRVAGRARPTTLADQLIGIADGIDPAEIAALGDALDSPGRRAVLARGPRAVPPARRRAPRMLRCDGR